MTVFLERKMKPKEGAMKKKWTQITIEYWSTNKEDWGRAVNTINKPLKGHYVSDTKVWINGISFLTKKKWWEIWK